MSDLTALAMNAIDGPVASLSVSELHGAVIGIAVGDPQVFLVQSLVDLLGAEALADQETVQAFVNEAVEALHQQDFSFTPMLPEDEVPLVERLEALGEWTQSFLAGLSAGLEGRDDVSFDSMNEQAKEIVADFAAIAAVEVEDDAASEDAEADFVELEEFVKVGALLLISLLNDVEQNPEE
ncbi:MAG: UPF0149 family protein [Pseudomonadales bacterium]|nr:UPF0149 family protein [Pseudomonadales bacterium]